MNDCSRQNPAYRPAPPLLLRLWLWQKLQNFVELKFWTLGCCLQFPAAVAAPPLLKGAVRPDAFAGCCSLRCGPRRGPRWGQASWFLPPRFRTPLAQRRILAATHHGADAGLLRRRELDAIR